MTDDSSGDIIELFPGAERTDAAAPVRARPRDPDAKWCDHRRLELDTEARRVYCRDCTREVPAFDAIHDLAHEWERYISARRHAKRQARDAQNKLAELERQERNAKARLRRLKARTAPSLTTQEIDYLIRFLEHYKPERLRLDSLIATLHAIRDDIDPPTENNTRRRPENQRT